MLKNNNRYGLDSIYENLDNLSINPWFSQEKTILPEIKTINNQSSNRSNKKINLPVLTNPIKNKIHRMNLQLKNVYLQTEDFDDKKLSISFRSSKLSTPRRSFYSKMNPKFNGSKNYSLQHHCHLKQLYVSDKNVLCQNELGCLQSSQNSIQKTRKIIKWLKHIQTKQLIKANEGYKLKSRQFN